MCSPQQRKEEKRLGFVECGEIRAQIPPSPRPEPRVSLPGRSCLPGSRPRAVSRSSLRPPRSGPRAPASSLLRHGAAPPPSQSLRPAPPFRLPCRSACVPGAPAGPLCSGFPCSRLSRSGLGRQQSRQGAQSGRESLLCRNQEKLLVMRPSELTAMVVVLLLATAVATANQAMVLERAVPLKGVPLGDLRELDRARQARMGVVNVPVQGNTNPFADGIYYTSLKLGNPPKEYTFQIDTGSDISWIVCKGCRGCPTRSPLKIPIELYNPNSSSTSSRISCSDNSCTTADESGSKVCYTSDSTSSLCGYNLTYGDGTGVSGYYVSDTMHLDTIMGNQHFANASASVVFGCTESLSGFISTDGILAFGQQQVSIISQLNSLGVSPKKFSHCLKGSEEGGGIFLLGEIVEPRLVFTPLAGPHYNLNLEGIAVNGQNLPIDSSLFATSNKQGPIVDSGTTLTYLLDEVYDGFVSAIVAGVSPSVRPLGTERVEKRDKCFLSSSSIDLLFPTVTLYFKGGAAMTMKPRNYLLLQGYVGNDTVWCIGWQSTKEIQSGHGITVLGEDALGLDGVQLLINQ
ncbi:aspartic proteinase 36 isoform X2 [Triticum aestivum]|uniref:aspartic proteinase 36 isoform X2 n=1 Tax=Triticum aestivum TaxID=4565 RepID=UPI001D022069|nr:aspartic proteinase 36-like isoform X2 [Triticum aestivum]